MDEMISGHVRTQGVREFGNGPFSVREFGKMENIVREFGKIKIFVREFVKTILFGIRDDMKYRSGIWENQNICL